MANVTVKTHEKSTEQIPRPIAIIAIAVQASFAERQGLLRQLQRSGRAQEFLHVRQEKQRLDLLLLGTNGDFIGFWYGYSVSWNILYIYTYVITY